MPAKRVTAAKVGKGSKSRSKRDRSRPAKDMRQGGRKPVPERRRKTSSDVARELSHREQPDLKRDVEHDLHHELLLAAVMHHNGRLRFPRASVETLATTYAALCSLERKKLIEPDKENDPEVISWKVTKAGKAAVSSRR